MSAVWTQAAASLVAAFLSGAMANISIICLPVLLETNNEAAHLYRQWISLYGFGHVYMPTIAVIATSMYAFVAIQYCSYGNKHWRFYATAAVVTISMVPFTWLVMIPTNNTIFSLAEAHPSPDDRSTAEKLLVKWGWLHIIRSLFPLTGAGVGLFGVLHELNGL